MDDLKNRSIDSHRIWVTANKPCSGGIFKIYKQDKYAYKLKIRKSREEKELDISNDLHDALCCRYNSSFWKIWNSKFNSSKNDVGHKMVGGLVDPDEISDAFSNYFRDICKPNSSDKNMLLHCKFEHRFVNYVGDFLTSDTFFTVELISKMICELKTGKAAGCDGLVIYPVVDRVDRSSRSNLGQVESIEKSSTRSTLKSSRSSFTASRVDRFSIGLDSTLHRLD